MEAEKAGSQGGAEHPHRARDPKPAPGPPLALTFAAYTIGGPVIGIEMRWL